MKKKSILYLVITILIIMMGLASRKFGAVLPSFLATYSGDALWASMVYFGLRFLFPALPIFKTGLYALLFSYFIEVSQLYQADWINAIRKTTIGALVLGHGFLWSDLVCYTAGIAIALLIDKLLIYRQ